MLTPEQTAWMTEMSKALGYGVEIPANPGSPQASGYDRMPPLAPPDGQRYAPAANGYGRLPVQANPVQANPVQANPVQANPGQANGDAASLGYSDPVAPQTSDGVHGGYGVRIPVEPGRQASGYDRMPPLAPPEGQRYAPAANGYGKLPVQADPANQPGGYVEPDNAEGLDVPVPYAEARPSVEQPDAPVAYAEAQGIPAEPAERKQWERVDTTPTPSGMKTRRVDETYEGEHNTLGWRKDVWANTTSGIERDNTRITTKLNSEQEVKDNTLVQAEDGRFRKGDGSSVASSEMGYAMDASGNMVVFKEGQADIVLTGSDNVTRRVPSTVGVGQEAFKLHPDRVRLELAHHSSALGGDVVKDASDTVVTDAEGRPMMRSRAAAAAGTVKFDMQGRIIEISNASGHYKPTVDFLIQGLERLLAQGAFFSDQLADANGNPLKPGDKAHSLYTLVQDRLAECREIAARAGALSKQLVEATDPEQQAALGQQIGMLSDELAALSGKVEEATHVLRKLGVAPAMRVRAVTAEYIDVKPEMTGAQVRSASAEKMDVEAFLRSGGGNTDQADNKRTMLDELEQTTSGVRGRLDQQAEKRAAVVGKKAPAEPAPSAKDVDQALADMAPRQKT
jgi:hypothetical protein